ncbi:MAG: AAA family ATPase [Oscillospiraceae bacterium]|nr:AAA family ATPase [Candidatus Equicaccousia limihippi]
MGRLFATVSGKGGVGKSTVCRLLASALSGNGKVLIIDLDRGMGSLDIMLNVNDRVVFDLSDLLSHKKTAEEVILNNQNIDLIPAPSDDIDFKALRQYLFNAVEQYDYVLVDFPAGLNPQAVCEMPRFCEFLLVVCQNTVSCRAAAAFADMIVGGEYLEPRLIVNRFSHKALKHNKTAVKNLDTIVDESRVRLLGIISEDKNVELLTRGIQPKAKSPAVRCVNKIAARLNFEDLPLTALKKL